MTKTEEKYQLTSEICEIFSNVRRELVSKFGISQEREIEKICKDLKLKPKKCILVPEEEIEIFKQLDKAGFHYRFLGGQNLPYGAYIPEIDLIVIFGRRERVTQDIIFENGFLIHELSHANHGFNKMMYFPKIDGYRAPRVGFQLLENSLVPRKKVRGSFLEEGFADYNRGKYMRESYPNTERYSELEISLRFGRIETDEVVPIKINDRFLPIPVKYLLFENGFPKTILSSIAGYGLELILDNYPDLENIMMEARKSPEGLRLFIQELTKIHPNLYRTLQDLKYETNDFVKGLAWIIDNIVGGIDNILLKNKSPELIRTWNNLLK